MPAPDIAVALIHVLANWQAFKQGHRLESPEYKCCEITIEFFKSLDHLQQSLEGEAAKITGDEDREAILEKRISELQQLGANRCYAFYTPDSGRHEEHHCTLKAGHEGQHKWSACRFCREEIY